MILCILIIINSVYYVVDVILDFREIIVDKVDRNFVFIVFVFGGVYVCLCVREGDRGRDREMRNKIYK